MTDSDKTPIAAENGDARPAEPGPGAERPLEEDNSGFFATVLRLSLLPVPYTVILRDLRSR